MNITINIECTPEEARRYMGLPDVGPMQEELIKEMQQRIDQLTQAEQQRVIQSRHD